MILNSYRKLFNLVFIKRYLVLSLLINFTTGTFAAENSALRIQIPLVFTVVVTSFSGVKTV